MEGKQKIIDKSGDKKYFTQIPNMIVNHSTAYEQSLYLIMKRIAGEGGSCYASLNFLAEKMGVHKTTISKTITKLLKRKWITETDKTKVKGGYTRTFVIIDLWPRNIKEYQSGAEMTTNQGGASVDGGGAVVDGSGAQSDTSKNTNKIENKKELAIQKIAEEKINLNPLIELFKGINPSYERLFANKSQRAALERLVKKHGIEKIKWTLNILPKTNTMQFAPMITTPIALENKLGDLIAFINKEKLKVENTKNSIVKI